MSLINHRNTSKLAFIFADKKPLHRWATWRDGLFAAIQQMSNQFYIRVYGYSDHAAFLEEPNFEIQLVDNLSSMKYWLQSFKPRYTYCVGSSVRKWSEIGKINATHRLIHRGNQYEDKNTLQFKNVILELQSEVKHFQNGICAFGTNTQLFRQQDLNHPYPAVYPIDKNHRVYKWSGAMPGGSLVVGNFDNDVIANCLPSGHSLLPQMPDSSYPYIYNSAAGVCMTPTTHVNYVSRVYEAMACNTPVLVTDDSPLSGIEGVWTCPPDVYQIRQAYIAMVLSFNNSGVNLYEDYIKDKHDEYAYARTLTELI